MVVFKKVKIEKSWDDIQPNFPAFPNLHLEMFEDRQKLKQHLPPIPLSTYTGEAMRANSYEPPSSHSKFNIVQSPVNKSPPVHLPPLEHSPPPSPIRSYGGSDRGSESEISDDDILGALGAGIPSRSTKESYHHEDKHHHHEDKHHHHEDKHHHHEDKHHHHEDKHHSSHHHEEPEPEPKPEDEGPTPEQIEEERQEYLYKLKKIRQRKPDLQLPPYGEHSTHDELKKIYDETMRDISVEYNIKSYKGYMTGSFLLIEFLCTQFFGINMTGYAKTQMSLIDDYNELLDELGEKSYMGFGSWLPVEVRLLGVILFNAAIFYIGKLIAEKGGETVSVLFASLFGKKAGNNSTQQETKKSATQKKKRRGPSTTAEDIKEMDD
jgi:hypothetical protein